LVEDQAHVTPDGRHLNEQITDKAISYIARQERVASGKPFFLYYAPGATHAPHQVDKYWSDQYKGKFDEGWDVFRERVLANQKKLGIVPSYAQLPPRNPRVQEWNTLSADQKKLFARFIEVYAGYLTYTDFQIGRLINYLKENRLLDNTIVYVIIGDNGASKEGTNEGVIEPKKNSSKKKTEADYLKSNLEDIDSIGTANAATNYPLGWAQAANTPYREWKQDADAEGGTHNPLIIFGPKWIKNKGGIRNQYGHVIDLLPTTIEFAGLKIPETIRGIKQDTIQGKSLVYSFEDSKAASKHTIQHYYIFGSRSIYANGWKAEAAHHPDNVDFDFKPGETIADKSFDEDVWSLYNLNDDFNERIDLAKKYPDKLAELQKLFDIQATKYNLYPLIDWYDVNNKRIHHPNGSDTQGPIK
jgi:arylsulfatase